MNDGPEAAPATPATKRRRCFKLLAVLALLSVAVGVWKSNSALGLDPRLVGEWQSDNGTAWIFHSNGRLEILMLPARTPAWPGGQRWWRTEGGELVTGTQTLKSRVRKWFDNLSSSWTKVQVIGLNDSRYKIVELTETLLQLRRIRPPRAPQLPIEEFQKLPANR